MADEKCPQCGRAGHMPRFSSTSIYDCGSTEGPRGFLQSPDCIVIRDAAKDARIAELAEALEGWVGLFDGLDTEAAERLLDTLGFGEKARAAYNKARAALEGGAK